MSKLLLITLCVLFTNYAEAIRLGRHHSLWSEGSLYTEGVIANIVSAEILSIRVKEHDFIDALNYTLQENSLGLSNFNKINSLQFAAKLFGFTSIDNDMTIKWLRDNAIGKTVAISCHASDFFGRPVCNMKIIKTNEDIGLSLIKSGLGGYGLTNGFIPDDELHILYTKHDE